VSTTASAGDLTPTFAPGGRGVGRPRYRASAARWALVVGMCLLAASAVFPIYFMTSAAFRTKVDWAQSKLGLPTTLSLDAFGRAWVQGNIGSTFVNSVIVTVLTVTLSLLVASMAGYAFAKMHWRGSTFTYFFVLAWMAIPPLLMMVPIYVEMVDLGLINTYWSVVLLYTALNTPFNAYLMTAFFRAIPDEMLEAARVDGASVHRAFVSIILPMSVPAVATLVIFNALYVWNEFVFALLLLQDDKVKTLTVGVMQMQGKFFFDYPALMAGLLIASIPVIGVYLVFQRYLVRAIAAGALK
jgi:ABC-type glycerol-3-phosphate transport system permease component